MNDISKTGQEVESLELLDLFASAANFDLPVPRSSVIRLGLETEPAPTLTGGHKTPRPPCAEVSDESDDSDFEGHTVS